jgi:hypothetical protein
MTGVQEESFAKVISPKENPGLKGKGTWQTAMYIHTPAPYEPKGHIYKQLKQNLICNSF